MVHLMHRFIRWAILLSAIAALALPSAAHASALIAWSGSHVTFKVGDHNRAVLSYTTNSGERRHVLIWGAINAKVPDPAHPKSQVQFHTDYSGGSASPWGAGYWRSVSGAAISLRHASPLTPRPPQWSLKSTCVSRWW